MRLFINQCLQIGEELVLDSFASNYIARVLRLKINECIIIFNGQNPLGEYLAKITHIDKKHVVVQILEFEKKDAESPIKINLLQGISRGDRMDYTIQKAVELGINSVFPLFLDRSHVKLVDEKRLHTKLAHWQTIAHSAMQQSGRTSLVMVNTPSHLSTIDAIEAELKLLADPKAQLSLSDLLKKDQPASINILIGPEGGITDSEGDFAKSMGYLPIKLGPRILRTETAGLAIISFLQGIWGDF